ncbi:MAG: B12-binding domain-containing radical SAM protein [Nitrospirae bacterium]|nr:B12-binding domain-containing radical SAM protein [Nitrospirota bacterium]
MKILLIQPPVRDFYDTDIRLQPIGLCYIRAAIRHFIPDVEVIIKDYHSGCGRKTVSIPKELAYLAEYYPVADKSPFSVFHRYYHFGASFDAIAAELAEIRPDIVGISSLFTPYYREALEVARRVKMRPGVPVVMGGPHVSEVPEKVLDSPFVDYIIQGEGERPMVEFIQYLRGRIRVEEVSGLGYKRRQKLCLNQRRQNYHIDQLPFPDLSDFPPARYKLNGRPMTFMITSRGCPHRCSFCSVHSVFGAGYRSRSVSNILEEIELRHRQGYRVIDFEDDNLTYHMNDFRELCRRLIERFPGRQMEFVAMNGTSYMNLNDELLELMLHAGFTKLNLSLVSADKDVRASAGRPHTLEAYVKVVDKAVELSFKTVSYHILGLPGDSIAGMVNTLAFNARLPVLLGASPFYRTPKSPLAQGLQLTEEDYIKARLTALAAGTGPFRPEDIYTLFITVRVINFLKGLDIPESSDLDTLLSQTWNDNRTRIGIEMLGEFLKTGVLNFHTSGGNIPNKKFNAELFIRVLDEAGHIGCLNGKRILTQGPIYGTPTVS